MKVTKLNTSINVNSFFSYIILQKWASFVEYGSTQKVGVIITLIKVELRKGVEIFKLSETKFNCINFVLIPIIASTFFSFSLNN